MTLYTIEKLSPAKIAHRLGISVSTVRTALQQSKKQFNSMLQPQRKEKATTIYKGIQPRKPKTNLSEEQMRILSLRREMKYSFNQIASLLKHPQSHVQKQYTLANRIIATN